MTTPYLPADIIRDEGLVLRAYPDSRGTWTIGVGHTGWSIRRGVVWTKAEAMTQLAIDIGGLVKNLDEHLTWWRKLVDPRQDVLVNMGFNLGIDGLLAFHHTLDAAEEGAYAMAAADMLLSEPWHSQVGKRCERLATQMRLGIRPTPGEQAA